MRRLRDNPLLQLGDSIWKGFLITFLYPYFHLFVLVTFHLHNLDSSFKQLSFILIDVVTSFMPGLPVGVGADG